MRAAVAVIAVLALASCRQVLGIPGDLETPGEGLSVGGTVRGARRAAPTLELVLNDGLDVRAFTDDTDEFRFMADFLAGEDYEVVANPDGVCTIDNGRGELADADVRITAVCGGLSALRSVGFSVPIETTLPLTLGGAYTSTASVLNQSVYLAPVREYDDAVIASVEVDGVQPPSAGDGVYGPLALDGSTTVEVRVEHVEVPARDYTVVVEPGAPMQFGYGKAATTAAGAAFGRALAADGDRVVVGAPDQGAGAGAVRVVARAGATWPQQWELAPTMPTQRDGFGASVAIDGAIVVVGAPGDDNGAVDSGAAYAFVFDGQSWTPHALKAAAPTVGAAFGAAVAVAPGVIVIGAPGASAERGAAYIFSTTTFTQVAALTVPAGQSDPGDRFGAAVAASTSWVAVGAPGEASGLATDPLDDSRPGAGAVYVFADTGWTMVQYLKAEPPGAGDAFGAALAMTCAAECVLVVGAPLEDSGNGDPLDDTAIGAGAAYVFTNAGTGWSAGAYLKAPQPDVGDGFGAAVAVRGRALAIGAPYEDSAARGVDGDATDETAADAGAVFVYDRSQPAAAPSYLKASNTGPRDQFGAALALSLETLLVGAPLEDSAAIDWNGDQGGGAIDAGAIYAFR